MMKSVKYLSVIIFSFVTIPVLAGGGHSHWDDSDYSYSHGHEHSHGHGHLHSHTPHDGIVKPLVASGELAGHLELKLHDDKGDLELWLTDGQKDKPFDISLASEIQVVFPELNNKAVVLRVRNEGLNEDEDGKGNIREGKTNYFIFPTKEGENAEFLVGKKFASKVVVSFEVNGESFSSAPFVLTPHTH